MAIMNVRELRNSLYESLGKPIVEIQAVNNKGEPLGEKVYLTEEEVSERAIIGRVDTLDGIEELPMSQVARTSDGKKRFYYVDKIVVRSPYAVREIGGVIGRYYGDPEEKDATHRRYVVIKRMGRGITIGYYQSGLYPLTVKTGEEERPLKGNEVIVLKEGEEVMIRLAGMYGVVGRDDDGELIVEKAWLKIQHIRE